MSFRDALAGLTDAVFEAFGEKADDGSPAAWLHPLNGAAASAVRAYVAHGVDTEDLFGGAAVKIAGASATIKVPYVDAPELAQNDVVEITAGRDAGRWRILGAPRRPGRGEVWLAPVQQAPAP